MGSKNLLLASLMMVTSLVQATPIVSLDVDLLTPGIQSDLSVALGESFDVDVLISNVSSSEPLRGFEFDLFFDSAVLSATNILNGNFLLPIPFVVESDVSGSDVNFAVTTLGSFGLGASGDGLLARVTFDTLADGTSLMSFSNVVLAVVDPLNPFGVKSVSLSTGDLNGGQVQAQVPEPGMLILLSIGGMALGAARRWRRAKRYQLV